MKRTLTILSVAAGLALTSCAQLVFPEIDETNENIMTLAVYGMLESNLSVEYPSVVDEESGTVIVQVPYYLSDTEKIMGDLTKMRVRANLPQGARFEPSIAGPHDLIEGFRSTLIYDSGRKIEYTFNAAYKKSSLAEITAVRPTNKNVAASIQVKQPEKTGMNGVINAIKTNLNAVALQECTVVTAPWCTLAGNSVSYNSEKDEYYVDILSGETVTVVSQDGQTKRSYDITFELPPLCDYGVSYIESAWAFQSTLAKPHGFEMDANRTLAIADGYLIVSNAYDPSKMLVLDKNTGDISSVKVNISTLPKDRQYRAISSDSAGHLIAVTFTCTMPETETSEANAQEVYKTDPNLSIWIWDKGIESAPRQLYSSSITGGSFAGLAVMPKCLGNTMGTLGDLTSGKANILLEDSFAGRVYAIYFEDGQAKKTWVQCGNVAGSAQWLSQWIGSKAIPLEVSDTWVPFMLSSGQSGRKVYICYENSMLTFDVPKTNFWAVDNSCIVLGLDCATINGATLLAVGNNRLNANIWAGRMYVADITSSPTQSSLVDGFLFETRENNGSDYQVPGVGYGAPGMTSTYPYEGGSGLGTKNIQIKCGDICFDKNSDPNEMLVFCMNMNAGIFAYRLSSYKL